MKGQFDLDVGLCDMHSKKMHFLKSENPSLNDIK